jgi:hypothetical protein
MKGETDTSSVANGAQEKAKQMGDEVSTRAQELAQKAKGPLRDQVDLRTTKLGRQVRTNADDVRSVARKLEEDGNDAPAKIANQAADRVEAVGAYLTESDGDKIISDVEEFSRRNPWAVAAAALALGFAASRALKASSGRRYSAGAVAS